MKSLSDVIHATPWWALLLGALAVMVDSGDFSRRSTIELDGEYDAPVHQMLFKELPEGDYVVAAEVLGADDVRGYAYAELRVLGHMNPKRDH